MRKSKNWALNAILLLILGLVGVFYACSTQEAQPVTNGQNYFPVVKGNYIVYNVRDIIHRFPSFVSDTAYYQLKESVGDTFTDGAGLVNYRLWRYRSDKNGNWLTDSVWSVRLSGSAAVLNQDNRQYIKLIFPLKEGATWNGYRYIDSSQVGTDLWRLSGLGKPVTINDSLKFASALNVTQRFDTNCRGKHINLETYANNIGLVFKQEINLEYSPTDSLCQRPFKIQIGRERTFTYLKNGKE